MTTLVTAGHVDHGKTALVRALTGVECDHLPEERRRGMTIELGAAPWTLPSGRAAAIVDVPGHHRLVRTMVAGAAGVDALLLVVAADEGVMPQTEEHLAVCELLGLRAAVVALTRCDLAEPEVVALAVGDVRERLQSTAFAHAPVVTVSAHTGTGLAELATTVDGVLAPLVPRPDLGRPRLFVERVFGVPGHGPVVTGTLEGGTLHAGDAVTLLPAGGRARVRRIERHGAAVPSAPPGVRTAVNLAGVDRDDLARGLAITRAGTVAVTSRLDAVLRRPRGTTGGIRHGAVLTLLAGTAAVPARVRLLEDDVVAGGPAAAQLTLERPLPLVPGDRLVLRDGEGTVGGGTVAEVAPRRHRRRDAAAVARVHRLAGADLPARILAAIDHGPHGMTAAAAGRRAGAGAELALAALREHAAEGGAVAAGGRWLTPAGLERLARRSDAVLGAAGGPAGSLGRAEWGSRMRLPGDLAAALLHRLATAGRLEIRGDALTLPGAAAAPDGTLEALIAHLDAAGLDPPAPAELRAAGLDARRLRHLVATGRAVRLGGDVVLSAGAYEAAVAAVVGHLQAHGGATVAALRDATGSSRRVVVPLLEHLDGQRITRREGDLRRLHRAAAPALP